MNDTNNRDNVSRTKRLLIIDDEANMRHMLASLLHKSEYLVDEASDGSIALQMVNQIQYDFILCDLKMPNMDGKKATRKIRQKGILDTPIIAITAEAMKGDREKCLRVGMDDYISKPIKREVVYSIIKKYCLEK